MARRKAATAETEPDPVEDIVNDTGDPDDGGPQMAGPSPDADLLSRLTSALESIAGRQSSGDSEALKSMAILAGAVERMTSGQMEGSKLIADATKRAQRPSNEIPPAISEFNYRGDKDFPKAQLKCRMLLPWEAEPDSLTREEIDLLNLMVPGEFIVRRNDATKIKITIRATYKLDSDVMDTLIMNHDTAFNNDYHALMPPMPDWLRQILRQSSKTRTAEKMVLSMEEELELINAGCLNDGSTPKDGIVVSQGA